MKDVVRRYVSEKKNVVQKFLIRYQKHFMSKAISFWKTVSIMKTSETLVNSKTDYSIY